MNTPFRAHIFDCDGTLVDTMPTHYTAWQLTMNKHGIHFPEDRFYALGGVPTETIIDILAKEAGVKLNVKLVAEEKDRTFIDMIGGIKINPAVVAIAKRFRGKLPLAVATGSVGWLAREELTAVGILDWFDALVGAEDVRNHKPAPDVYLEAADRVGVRPEDCCAYEDTDIGLQSARAAGMHAVDVRTISEP